MVFSISLHTLFICFFPSSSSCSSPLFLHKNNEKARKKVPSSLKNSWNSIHFLCFLVHHLLPSEWASLGQSCFTTSRLAENLWAASADYNSLGVWEDSGDCEAAGTLYIHEEGAGCWHECLNYHQVAISKRGFRQAKELWRYKTYLELMLLCLSRGCWVK